MEFTDGETASARSQKEEAKYKDIYAGEVRCGNEILFFERVLLYDDRFSVMLPKGYVDLPKSLAKVKYPMENRPAVIKTNDDTTVNFAFGYYNQAFSEAQVESAAKGLKAGLGRMSPGARFFETRIMQTEEGVKFSCFDFLTTALDTELYQLFGFVPVRKQFLHVIFNAPSKLMRTWQPIAMQVLQSIRDTDLD
ncbi:MAG: hypothetical protein LBH28_01920 [Oscillospiraceae bacterium]|jgi:hypothetical protein|nr:hypothetical protein [Oscillospiraceae bacterium]